MHTTNPATTTGAFCPDSLSRFSAQILCACQGAPWKPPYCALLVALANKDASSNRPGPADAPELPATDEKLQACSVKAATTGNATNARCPHSCRGGHNLQGERHHGNGGIRLHRAALERLWPTLPAMQPQQQRTHNEPAEHCDQRPWRHASATNLEGVPKAHVHQKDSPACRSRWATMCNTLPSARPHAMTTESLWLNDMRQNLGASHGAMLRTRTPAAARMCESGAPGSEAGGGGKGDTPDPAVRGRRLAS